MILAVDAAVNVAVKCVADDGWLTIVIGSWRCEAGDANQGMRSTQCEASDAKQAMRGKLCEAGDATQAMQGWR